MTDPNIVPLVARHATSRIEESLSDTPVTVIQGARQVGKSTLARTIVERHGGDVLSLDDGEVRDAARRDPAAFVRQAAHGILTLDELQLAPWLLRPITVAVDQDRRPGRFLLTGSADLLHVSGANESLAGRAETVDLYGLSAGELAGRRDDFITNVIRAGGEPPSGDDLSRDHYGELIARGGYPEVQRRSVGGRSRWFNSYLARVTDHDAAQVSGLRDLDRLSRILT